MDKKQHDWLLNTINETLQHEENLRMAQEKEMDLARHAHEINLQICANCASAKSEAANISIRALMLVNGGAVLTLLAFVGFISVSNIANFALVKELVTKIFYFAMGVGCVGIAALSRYGANHLDNEIALTDMLRWEYPSIVDTKRVESLGKRRELFNYIGFIAAFLAITFFFLGVVTVTRVISGNTIFPSVEFLYPRLT